MNLSWLMTLRIDKPQFLATVDIIAAILIVYLLVRRPSRRWFATAAIALVGGALIGLLTSWIVVDVLDTFGVGVSTITRMWVALVFGGSVVAIVNLWRSRWWRKVIAALAIPVFLIAGAAAINVDFGAYRNLNDAIGVNPYKALSFGAEHGSVENVGTDYAKGWHAPANMPSRGSVTSVTIPGLVSHFDARAAVVYLPPAAQTANPPVLPVLISFAGQPGSPADMFTAARIASVMDSYAAAHHGIAPIIVAPDQLRTPDHNPMCVDSRLGNSATYVLTDVLNWIRAHFRVSSDKNAWGIVGYSQGATCAIQFTAGHPEIFGSSLSISSELGPTVGAQTVALGFGGSVAAFRAAQPSALMAAHAPYKDTMAIFAVGGTDAKYMAFAHTLVTSAAAAGMTTSLIVSPHSAHDWNTVRYALEHGFPILAPHLGLAP